MAEEAHARPRTCQYDVKTGGLADVSSIASVALEANSRRRIMHQYDVHALTCSEPLHLVVGIVAPRVADYSQPDTGPGARLFRLPQNWLINHFFGTLPS